MAQKTEIKDEEIKLQIVREVLFGQCTLEEACDKYNLASKRVIKSWIRLYELYGCCGIFSREEIPEMEDKKEVGEAFSGDTLASKRRIRELERQLSEQQLLSEMYQRMIEIAEKEYKVSIRKNSSTK
jgi:transposase-like protein